ncbi:hypothetical protein HYQ45_018213 [Verticillium longisporum]|uniref:Uncharacterized protein n=1 Tax=Verticillium longisporum TaxID=100787 RepID=A0A0G4KSK1_VERLO|nr:hypothetical protein HYQ45_018213 [Verticillium longisporum]KAG7117959.1 hypothetical protein HYQ44_006082 [Verticillium longisporum]CRK12727.1 hypothetical protein BN1708_010581 [Verticillium longisporum]
MAGSMRAAGRCKNDEDWQALIGPRIVAIRAAYPQLSWDYVNQTTSAPLSRSSLSKRCTASNLSHYRICAYRKQKGEPILDEDIVILVIQGQAGELPGVLREDAALVEKRNKYAAVLGLSRIVPVIKGSRRQHEETDDEGLQSPSYNSDLERNTEQQTNVATGNTTYNDRLRNIKKQNSDVRDGDNWREMLFDSSDGESQNPNRRKNSAEILALHKSKEDNASRNLENEKGTKAAVKQLELRVKELEEHIEKLYDYNNTLREELGLWGSSSIRKPMNENRLQRVDKLKSLSESWMKNDQSQQDKGCFEPRPKLNKSLETSNGQRHMVQGIGEFSGRFPSLLYSNPTGHNFGVGDEIDAIHDGDRLPDYSPRFRGRAR